MRHKFSIFLILILSIPGLTLGQQQNSCPLVARQSYEALFRAVDTLEKDLSRVIHCNKESSDMRALLQAQAQLKSSTNQLHQYWQDPTLAATDSAAFAQSLTQAIGSVNSIGDNISKSTLIQGTCGGEPSTGKILISINEVVTNLAPLALLAGTLTGGVAQAVPWVLGVAGVSSIIKILSSTDSNKPDMTKSENRELVLRAACEFTRIQQRIRYLTLMQKGEVESLRAELKTRNEQFESSLDGNPQLAAKVNEYKARTLNLEQNWKVLNSYRERFRKDLTDYRSLRDDHYVRCGYLKSFASSKALPYYPMDLSAQLGQLGIKPDTDRKAAVFYAFANVDNEVRQKLPEINADKLKADECGNLANRWMLNIGEVLEEAADSLRSQQNQIYSQLNKDTSYLKWSQNIADIEGQKILLEKLLQFMDAKQDTSVMVDRAEINQRLDSLKNVLFGSGSNWASFSEKSQVGAWLKHTERLYTGEMREFNRAYQSMASDAMNMAFSLPLETRKNMNRDDLVVTSLRWLKSEYFPKNKPGHNILCRALEDAWLSWSKAQDYLSNVELFCKVIAESIRNRRDLDSSIVKMCAGKLKLNGDYETLPRYVQLMQDQHRPRALDRITQTLNRLLVAESDSQRASIVRTKQRELSCTLAPPAM